MKLFFRRFLVGAMLSGLAPLATYGQFGAHLWTQRFDFGSESLSSGRDVAADAKGDVYVTGHCSDGTNSRLVTIKYASTGSAVWTNFFFEPPGNPSGGRSIAVGANGSIFVLGNSFTNISVNTTNININFTSVRGVLLAYSNSGVPLWTNRFSQPKIDFFGIPSFGCLGVDATNGQVYFAGATSNQDESDFVTRGYSNNGSPLWTNYFGSVLTNASTREYATAIAVAGNGNVYVAGTSLKDYVTIAYSPNGAALWTNRYSRLTNSEDYATAVAVASNGDVIVTGWSESSGLDPDDRTKASTIAYHPDGTPHWTNHFCRSPGNGAYGAAVVTSSNGNIYVTGTQDPDGGIPEYVTLGYSASGTPLWTNYFSGPTSIAQEEGEQAIALGLDPYGNVYVAGEFENQGDVDWATVAYTATGSPLWTNYFAAGGGAEEVAQSIVANVKGEVFVVGTASSPDNGPSKLTLVKYAGQFPSEIPLQIQRLGNEKVVLSWPDARFGLQAAYSPAGAFTNILGATSPSSNAITGAQRYFRLKAN
jgi:hypothetical protein